jgi:hypothetical protein
METRKYATIAEKFTYYLLREEHRLRVFENRVLKTIFGPKGDEVTGERRKLQMGSFINFINHQILLGR